MAAITVTWREGMHFCSHTASGELMCDESSEVGKAYPSSPELLLAALGSCIGSALVYFGERHDYKLRGMQIHLDYDMAQQPKRIGKIDVTVEIPQSLSEDQHRTLERVAEACLIHNTLLQSPEINISLSGKSA